MFNYKSNKSISIKEENNKNNNNVIKFSIFFCKLVYNTFDCLG